MNNYENEIFGFGNNMNNDLDQANNFNYNSISGLGESDYENEDLFKIDEEPKTVELVENNNEMQTNNIEYNPQLDNSIPFEYNFAYDNNLNNSIETNVVPNEVNNMEQSNTLNNNDFWNGILPFQTNENQSVENTVSEVEENGNLVEPTINPNNFIFDFINPQVNTETVENSIDETIEENLEPTINEINNEENSAIEPSQNIQNSFNPEVNDFNFEFINSEEDTEEDEGNGQVVNLEEEIIPSYKENETDSDIEPIINEIPVEEPVAQLEPEDVITNLDSNEVVNQEIGESPVVEELPIYDEDEEEISISDTPIEELKELTKYEEDNVETTDINSLFDKVSVNVKDASDIFRKNTDMKAKIDTRFEELKKLQSEVGQAKQKQLDEINKYKEEIFEKLNEKKEEIERRLNVLKEYQANLEKEKLEFEKYKKSEQENIDKVQKEVQAAYDDRREELNSIEDQLRKQKDALDEERNQLSLDRIQYEADKNELANNLLKFNELVNSFTNGVNNVGRE